MPTPAAPPSHLPLGTYPHGVPLKGMYEGYIPSAAQLATANSRLAAMAAAGFGMCINYSLLYGDEASLLAYFAYAASLGFKLAVPMGSSYFYDLNGRLCSTYPTLAASLGASTDAQFINALVTLLNGNPGLWGWYLCDEVPVAYAGNVQAIANLVTAVDKGAYPRLGIFGGTNVLNIVPTLQAFASSLTQIGIDFYPFGCTPSPTPQEQVGWASVLAQQLASVAGAAGLATAFALQAHDLSLYGNTPGGSPTLAQMRQERDLVLLSCLNPAPSLLLWYSYFDILRVPGGNVTQAWHNCVCAAADCQCT